MSVSNGDRDKDPFAGAVRPPSALSSSQKRTRLIASVLLIGGLGIGLALSTRSTVPSGGTSSMSGMDMSAGADHIGISLEDVDGTPLALPGGIPGAVLFMSSDGCPGCLGSAKALAAAAEGTTSQVTLVSTNPDETRADLLAFDAAAGGLDVRYAVDDPSRSIAQQFDVRETGTIVVYDRSGMIVKRISPGRRQIRQIRSALR